MTVLEHEELKQQKRLNRETLKQIQKGNRLKYRLERLKHGQTSPMSKIITIIAIASYIGAVAFGIHLMYYTYDASNVYALFGSVAVPAGAAIFAFIQKNTKENLEGGVSHDTAIISLKNENAEEDGSCED